MYRAAGGSAVYTTSPLQRCLRDVHVVTQHMMVSEASLELVGRVLLGVDVDASML
jgi:alkylation response protein AidB-like acyl-CoA dehydrogenase